MQQVIYSLNVAPSSAEIHTNLFLVSLTSLFDFFDFFIFIFQHNILRKEGFGDHICPPVPL